MLSSIKVAILTILTMFILLPISVNASFDPTAEACVGIETTPACADSRAGQTNNPLFGPEGIITIAVSLVSILGGIIAVIILFIAGISFATAQGDAQSISKARSTIIYAAVGLAVALLAQAIVQLVLGKLNT